MSCTSTAAAEPPGRILIVRLGAMGDVIHTLPAAADLRRRYPRARIDWAVESRWAPLLQENPHIDAVIPLPLRRWRREKLRPRTWRDGSAEAKSLRAAGYELALDFQGLLQSAIVAKLSGARRVIGFERRYLREGAAALAYSGQIVPLAAHVVDHYRELAASGEAPGSMDLAVFPLPVGQPRAGLPERFTLASPQAGWGSKQWPAEHYSELAALLWDGHEMPLVLDCAPGQEAYAEEIARRAPPQATVVHPSTLPQLIAATRQARAVVGVDSGPLHLAAALGKPGVALFGPTDPERNGPYGKTLTVLRAASAETTYKRKATPAASMRALSPQTVYRNLQPPAP